MHDEPFLMRSTTPFPPSPLTPLRLPCHPAPPQPAAQQQQRQQQGSRLPIPTFASVLAPLVFLSPSLLLMPDIAQGLSVASLLQDPEVGSEFAAELPATLEEQP
jgi:hypothetical protein